MKIDLAVVPVAGPGTRLLPSTKSQPKEMLPVGRKPVVQYVVEELAASGVDRLLFVTGPGKTSIENHFDINVELIESLRHKGKEELLQALDFERQRVQYFYTRQRRQLGLGHAVLCAQPLVGDQPFIVALGDSIVSANGRSTIVNRMNEVFYQEKADAVIAFEQVPLTEAEQHGIARPGIHGQDIFPLEDIIEKPSADEAPSNLAVAARYVFRPRIFELLGRTLPGKDGEIQLTDAVRALLQQGGKVMGVLLNEDERRFHVGDFGSYFKAFVEFALRDDRYGADLREYVCKALND